MAANPFFKTFGCAWKCEWHIKQKFASIFFFRYFVCLPFLWDARIWCLRPSYPVLLFGNLLYVFRVLCKKFRFSFIFILSRWYVPTQVFSEKVRLDEHVQKLHWIENKICHSFVLLCLNWNVKFCSAGLVPIVLVAFCSFVWVSIQWWIAQCRFLPPAERFLLLQFWKLRCYFSGRRVNTVNIIVLILTLVAASPDVNVKLF